MKVRCVDRDINDILRDPDISWLVTTTQGNLEMKLAAKEVTNEDVLALVGCSLDTHPKGSNWVEDAGGLPEYICQIARSIAAKKGRPISNAISIAVGVVKRWASGVGDVNADTRAKAAKAVAQWTALKAKNRAKKTAAAVVKGSAKGKKDPADELLSLATVPIWIAPHESVDAKGGIIHVKGHMRHVNISPGTDLPSTGTFKSKTSTAQKAASAAPSTPETPDVKETLDRATDQRFARIPDLGDGIPEVGSEKMQTLIESVVPNLREGEVYIIGAIMENPSSTNQVMIAINSEGRLRVVKPKSGFKSGPEEAHREIGQELAALAINKSLGDVYRMPDVTRNEDESKLVGAKAAGMSGGFQDSEYVPQAQLWSRVSKVDPVNLPEGSPERVKASTDAGFGTMETEDRHRIALLDAVLGNVDRHGGNIGISGEPPPPYVAIDHGRTMPDVTEPQDAQVKKERPPITLTQWMSQNASDELALAEGDRTSLEGMLSNWDQVKAEIEATDGATPEAIDEMKSRVEYMLSSGRILGDEEFATRPWAAEGDVSPEGPDVPEDVDVPTVGGKSKLPPSLKGEKFAPGYTKEAASYEQKTRKTGGPTVKGEKFAPGYTKEAASYEQKTRKTGKKPTDSKHPALGSDTGFKDVNGGSIHVGDMVIDENGNPFLARQPDGKNGLEMQGAGYNPSFLRSLVSAKKPDSELMVVDHNHEGRADRKAPDNLAELAKKMKAIKKKDKKGLNSSVGNTKLTAAVDELRAIVALSEERD